MRRHRISWTGFTVALVLLFGIGQHACGQVVTWGLDAPSVVEVGMKLDVDIIISSLGAGIAPSLGAFDLDIGFDPAILSPVDVSFGPLLGTPPSTALSSFSFSPGLAH